MLIFQLNLRKKTNTGIILYRINLNFLCLNSLFKALDQFRCSLIFWFFKIRFYFSNGKMHSGINSFVFQFQRKYFPWFKNYPQKIWKWFITELPVNVTRFMEIRVNSCKVRLFPYVVGSLWKSIYFRTFCRYFPSSH